MHARWAGRIERVTYIDPEQVLREARDLTDSGAYAEALERHRWFHENSVTHMASLYGVRRSFALRSWARLGDLYPPARAALEHIRNAKATALRDGARNRELFDDVEAINATIGQIEQTRDLFVYIAERDREFAQKCFRSALPALVQGRDFASARSFISSPRETLDQSVNQLNENIQDLPVPETESSARLKEAYIKIYVEDVLQLLEVLKGVGEVGESERLRVAAVESVAAPVIRDEIRGQLRGPLPQSFG